MAIDILQQFSAINEDMWLSAALKSLKLDDRSQLEKKLNKRSVEGIHFDSFYSREVQPLSLSSFPAERRLLAPNEKLSAAHFDVYQSYIEKKTPDSDADKYLIDTSIIHNAGGSIVQELAFALGLIKYVDENFDKKPFLIKLALDSLYFNNIAKLRAMRFMLESLQAQCSTQDFELLAVNSQREQTLYDPWVNMLRGTSDCAAAFIGGADIIAVSSYDELGSSLLSKKVTGLGERQAINTYRVLAEESHLDQVKDPAKGSYAIESLTHQYIDLSFSLFKKLEKDGGVLSNLTKLSIEVEKVAKQRAQEVASLKYTIAGVNNYPNVEDELEKLYGGPVEINLGKDLFPLRRNAYEFERLRQSLENKTFRALVLAYGDEAKISARLMFCTNYMELLGHACQVQFWQEEQNLANYDVVVLCTQDELYESWLAQLKLPADIPIFIAGKKFSKTGMQNIYMGQDVLQVLKEIAKEKK